MTEHSESRRRFDVAAYSFDSASQHIWPWPCCIFWSSPAFASLVDLSKEAWYVAQPFPTSLATNLFDCFRSLRQFNDHCWTRLVWPSEATCSYGDSNVEKLQPAQFTQRGNIGQFGTRAGAKWRFHHETSTRHRLFTVQRTPVQQQRSATFTYERYGTHGEASSC